MANWGLAASIYLERLEMTEQHSLVTMLNFADSSRHYCDNHHYIRTSNGSGKADAGDCQAYHGRRTLEKVTAETESGQHCCSVQLRLGSEKPLTVVVRDSKFGNPKQGVDGLVCARNV